MGKEEVQRSAIGQINAAFASHKLEMAQVVKEKKEAESEISRLKQEIVTIQTHEDNSNREKQLAVTTELETVNR